VSNPRDKEILINEITHVNLYHDWLIVNVEVSLTFFL